jgi:hypothetical protein
MADCFASNESALRLLVINHVINEPNLWSISVCSHEIAPSDYLYFDFHRCFNLQLCKLHIERGW